MGFNIGKQKSEGSSRPSDLSEVSGGILMEQFFPGISQTGAKGLGEGTIGAYQDTGGTVAGALPSMKDLGTYNTLFEKASAGKLDKTAQGVFDAAYDMLTNPVGLDMSQINAINSSIGSGGAINVPDPPGIGKITSQIVADLPSNFQTFINNIMQDSSPEAIQAELDNLSTALTEQGQADADSLGGQLMGVFAAQGATGGAAIKGMQSLGLQIATRTMDDIAKARLAGLDTLIRARDQGINLMNSLLQSGAAEQANIVRKRVAEIESQTAIQVAKIQESGATSRALISANASLQLGKMQFTGDIFESLLGESSREEQTRAAALNKPYDILTALATGMSPKQSNTSSGFDFGIKVPLPGSKT